MKTTKQYKYDAFISYSHKDERWVSETLLPRLEENGIKVMIDYRDFEPGAPSITEMERAVKESWKTILVMTPDYMSSAWSEFESVMIATLDPNGKQRRIVPILLKDCEIPLRINYLTYLNFVDTNRTAIQWEKLLAIFDKKIFKDSQSNENRAPLKAVNAISQVSSDILSRLRKILMDSDELASTVRLRAVFADPRLSPFKNNLPEATSVAERTDLLLDFLVNRKLRTGENLLEIFLEILRSKIDPNDARISELENIISLIRNPNNTSENGNSLLTKDGISDLSIETLEGYQKLAQRYRQNLLVIEERMATFIDPRNVAPDLEIARLELIKRIQELEYEISSQKPLIVGLQSKIDTDNISNQDLMNRLDRLENFINITFSELKGGLAYIYQNMSPNDAELLERVFDEVHRSRIEQGKLQHIVEATGRSLKHILSSGVKVDDPNIAQSLAEIHQSLNKKLSLEQQLELTLPVIPFLLDYKVNLGADSDLQKIWSELVSRFKA